MNYADLQKAEQLGIERRELTALAEALAIDNALNATINGRYLGDDFIARIRPVIFDELRAKLAENERAFAEIGVAFE